MRAEIDIVVNRTHQWGPEDLETGLLNGSEEMVVELSRQLAFRGHDVTVICTLKGRAREVYGVKFMSRAAYQRDKTVRAKKYLIAFKEPKALEWKNYRKSFLWTADPTILTPAQRTKCDTLYGISLWHQTELIGLNPGFWRIGSIEPGLTPTFDTGEHKKVPYQCLYASSHDRGLDDLLEMWPEIVNEVPEATLVVTYGNPNPDLKPPDRVYFIGRLANKAMNELYQSSDVMLYPCTGGERFCIAALKAQYHGCIPCVVPKMALQDTVQFGVKCRKEKFTKNAVKLLLDSRRKDSIRTEMLRKLRFDSWSKTATTWEEILVDKRQSTHTRKRARS